jgi:hypothetical protein
MENAFVHGLFSILRHRLQLGRGSTDR